MVDDPFEEWKPISRWNGKYEASNLGKIRNSATGYLYVQAVTAEGYRRITAWLNGKNVGLLVHRLVMEAFHGLSRLPVDHIDGNRANNALSNLRYCTDTENSLAAIARNIDKRKGAYPRYGKWRSGIQHCGRQIHLGYFTTEEEARAAYLEAKRKYHGLQPGK